MSGLASVEGFTIDKCAPLIIFARRKQINNQFMEPRAGLQRTDLLYKNLHPLPVQRVRDVRNLDDLWSRRNGIIQIGMKRGFEAQRRDNTG